MTRVIIGLLLGIAATSAQPAAARRPARIWNPDTVATVTGTVEAVERVEMGESWRCVRLRLRTADGVLRVRVGPDWYLTERKVEFAAGQELEVKGSRVTFAGEPSVLAGEIVRGGERIVLRDPDGKATWAR
jgi:hypothetical protein